MNLATRPGLLRNLQIGFGLSLLILIVSSVASYSSIQNLLESARQVDHTDSVINRLEDVMSTMKDAETGQRGYPDHRRYNLSPALYHRLHEKALGLAGYGKDHDHR